MPVQNPILVCLACEHRAQNCAGPCPCRIDGVCFTEHAELGDCPLGRHANSMEDLRDEMDPARKLSVRKNMPVQQVIDLIGADSKTWIDGWQHWPNVQEAYRHKAAEVAKSAGDFPADRNAGRGIVICGGGIYFASAYVVIRVLRHLGCTLPIELWMLPDERDEWQAETVAPYGVTVHTPGEDFRFAASPGWQLKSYALLHSAFREVLFLDADCYPIREPSFLFDEPDYRQHGAAFWPDQPRFDLMDATWGLLAIPPRREPDVEAGVMLIDKSRVWTALSLAVWMNQHSDYWYRVAQHPGGIHGDKTTWHLAWRFLLMDYTMPSQRWDWLPPALLQKDFSGAWLFVHRVSGKLALNEDASGQTVFTTTAQDATAPNPALPLEDLAWGFLDELKRLAQPMREQPPSLANKVIHGVLGIIKAHLRIDRPADELIAKRMGICKTCEFAVNVAGEFKTCKVCGCSLWHKVRNAKEACPKGRWKAAESD